MSRQTLVENLEVTTENKSRIALIEKLFLNLAVHGRLKQISSEFESAEVRKLGEVCDLYQPKTISISQLIPNGKYPVYGANGVIGSFDQFNHEDSEVLVTCRGATCGTVNISQPYSWINGNAMVVRPKKSSLRKDFLALVLRSLDYKMVITGTAQPQITKAPLANVNIILPPLSAQEIVVSTMKSISVLLSNLGNKTLQLELLRNSFRESAVDAISTAQTQEEFETAWNRIQQNWKVITGTPEAVDSLRKLILAFAAKGKLVDSPDKLKNNSTFIELAKVCKVSWGNLSLTKSSYLDNGPHLAVSAAGPDGRIGFAEHKAYIPVLSAIGARCGTMFMPEEDFTAIKNTMTLEPNNELLDNWYLFYTMMGSTLPRRGSAQPFMSKSDIENFKIRVPSLDEQRLISKSVEALLEKCDLLESKLRDLEEIAEKFARSVVSEPA